MNLKIITLCLIFTFSILDVSICQVSDNFNDGELLNNPTWTGDIDEFTVVQSVLQSNGDTTSSTNREIYISTVSTGINNMVWEFFVNPKVGTSSNNRVDVYLVSNHGVLTGNNSGYFVRIGGTPDEVALFRKDNTGVEAYVIVGTSGVINSNQSNPTKVKVLRDSLGTWTLYADYTGIGNSYELVGEAFDATYTSSAFFGILVRYSNTNRQNYLFDGLDAIDQNAGNCLDDLSINPILNIAQVGEMVSFNAQTLEESPSYIWQSDLGQGFQTLFDFGKYSGTSSATLNISNIDFSQFNQAIRVISTSGACIDTSDIATISLLDTCIVIVNDTNLITVTDTLLINVFVTDLTPSVELNTIKLFPNPTSSLLNIDYGAFSSLSGYQLTIENSLGQEVFATNINQQSDILSLDSWGGNGLYFVHITDPQGNTIDIRKIILSQ